MLEVHKCDNCQYRSTLINNLVGCTKKKKIIINKGDYDNCEDYQQNLVSLDAFKTIFGNAFG